MEGDEDISKHMTQLDSGFNEPCVEKDCHETKRSLYWACHIFCFGLHSAVYDNDNVTKWGDAMVSIAGGRLL